MAQVCAREAPRAACTGALLVDRTRVVPPASLLDDDAACARQRLTVAGVARGEHAVEHVDPRAHGHDEVARRPYAHEVARPLRIERWGAGGQSLIHTRHGLADREAAEGQAIEARAVEGEG